MLMENIITNKKAAELMLISARIRRSALEMVYRATSGHLGGSFSICELLTALYFNEMNIDPQKPHCPDRDRLVLSKGHCTPALYSALEQLEEAGCPCCQHIQKARDILQAALEPPDPLEKTYSAFRNPPVDKRGKIG